MKIDDLLAELDDLPSGTLKGKAPASQPDTQHHHHRVASVPGGLSQAAAQSRSTAIASTSNIAGNGSLAPHHVRAKSAPRTGNHELDELFQDLDLDSSLHAAPGAPPPSAAETNGISKSSPSIGTRQKCGMLFVGGTRFTRGRMNAVGQVVCCDSLRCTKCDFRVEHFNNKEWALDVDYLFFRNNFPTESKLAPKLVSRPQSVAYCCQCSWLDAQAEKKLDFSSEVRWVCGGHQQ